MWSNSGQETTKSAAAEVFPSLKGKEAYLAAAIFLHLINICFASATARNGVTIASIMNIIPEC